MSLEEEVDAFCMALRRRQIVGSLPTAKRTAELMRLLITSQRHTNAQHLLDDVRLWGTTLQSAKPSELAIGNIVRRVLHMIREEAQHEAQQQEGETPRAPAAAALSTPPADEKEKEKGPGLLSKMLRQTAALGVRTTSLRNLLDQPPPASQGEPPAVSPTENTLLEASLRRPSRVKQPVSEAGTDWGEETERGRKRRTPTWKHKPAVIEQVNELVDELDEIAGNIALQAVEHMHANEVILTMGHSNTTQLFLIEAAKKRDFQVVVAEGGPEFSGHRMARALAEAGINTTAISDSAIFAMMPLVNKVLMGAHALLANGSVMAPVGSHLVALAAKRHSVPFVVLAGLHKLSPLFPHDPSVTFNDFQSPAAIIDYDVVAAAAEGDTEDSTRDSVYVHVPNPTLDYVPPELISLFVTDTGGYTPSYVYRLLAEYYTREDYGLSRELLDNISR